MPNPLTSEQQDQRPVTVTLEGPVEVRLMNEIITALQTIVGPSGAPVTVSGSGAGSISVTAFVTGKTAAGDEEPVLLDNQRILRNRPYEPFRRVASVLVAAAWTTVYTCPADTTAIVRVGFGVAAGGSDCTVGLRAQGRQIVYGVPVYFGQVGPLWEVTVHDGDIIEAYRVTGTNCEVHISARLYSLGDTATGV